MADTPPDPTLSPTSHPDSEAVYTAKKTGKETILIVQSRASARRLASYVLEIQGYKVLLASNGQEAFQVTRNHRGKSICLVVTDLVMPVMGGKIMWEWLRKAYPRIKVLFISEQMNHDSARHGVSEAGVEFLASPYTPKLLLEKVRELSAQETPSPPFASEARPMVRGIVETAYLEL